MPSTFAACADYAPSTSEGFAADLTGQCVARCMVPDNTDLDAGARHQQPLVRRQHGFKTSAGAPSFTACNAVVHYHQQQRKLGVADMPPYHDLCRTGSFKGLL